MRGPSRDCPAFPEIEAELGYNPTRFLDQPVGTDGQTAELSAKGLIRGIQDIETIRAWIEVEVALERGRNGGPRQQVITWINHRQTELRDTDEVTRGSNQDNSSTTPNASTAVATDGGAPSPPQCPDCHSELTREKVGTETAHWCPFCGGFREPTGGTA